MGQEKPNPTSGIRRWVKDPFSGLSHALGALLSIAALLVLLGSAGGRPWATLSLAVYGTSLILLYAASAAAHSVYCSPRTGAILDHLDYAAIYLLIAGTYTPICLGPLRGTWGWGMLAAEWGLAATGIAALWLTGPTAQRVRLVLYVVMGWLGVVAVGPLVRVFPPPALAWLLAGGAAYTVGAVVFATDRPRLWPGRFAAHDLWHCLVLLGSGCHFVLIARFVAV